MHLESGSKSTFVFVYVYLCNCAFKTVYLESAFGYSQDTVIKPYHNYDGIYGNGVSLPLFDVAIHSSK